MLVLTLAWFTSLSAPPEPLRRGWARQLGPRESPGAPTVRFVHVAADAASQHAVIVAHIPVSYKTAGGPAPLKRRRRRAAAPSAWWNPFAASAADPKSAANTHAAADAAASSRFDDPPLNQQRGGAFVAWMDAGGAVVRQLRFGANDERVAAVTFAGGRPRAESMPRPLFLGSTHRGSAALERWDLDATPPSRWRKALYPSSADLQSSVTAATAAARPGIVLVAGKSSGLHPLPGQLSSGGVDGFWARVNATSGKVISTHQFGTPSLDEPAAIAVSGSAGQQRTYVVGHTYGETDFFSAGSAHPSGTRDAAIWIFDHNGVELWEERFGSLAADSAADVAVVVDTTGADDAFIVGRTAGTMTTHAPSFAAAAAPSNASDAAAPSAVNIDGFLVKMQLDKGDAVQWVRQFGTPQRDVATGVTVGADGRIFVVGTTDGDFFHARDGRGRPRGRQHRRRGFVIVFDHTGVEIQRAELVGNGRGAVSVSGAAALRGGLLLGGVGSLDGDAAPGQIFATRYQTRAASHAVVQRSPRDGGGAAAAAAAANATAAKTAAIASANASSAVGAVAARGAAQLPRAGDPALISKAGKATVTKQSKLRKAKKSKKGRAGKMTKKKKKKAAAAAAALSMAERLAKLEQQLAAVDENDAATGAIIAPTKKSFSAFADEEKRAASLASTRGKKARQKMFLWPEPVKGIVVPASKPVNAPAMWAANATALQALLPPALPGVPTDSARSISSAMVPHLEHHAKVYRQDLAEVNDFFRQYTRDIAALKDQLTTLRDGKGGTARGQGGGLGGRLVDHFEREARAGNELDAVGDLAEQRRAARSSFPAGHALAPGRGAERATAASRPSEATPPTRKPWDKGRATTTVTASAVGFLASEMILLMTGVIMLALYPVPRTNCRSCVECDDERRARGSSVASERVELFHSAIGGVRRRKRG